jgi:hypothetical protein
MLRYVVPPAIAVGVSVLTISFTQRKPSYAEKLPIELPYEFEVSKSE